MYEEFYGFREKPFNLTPDPRYLYLSVKHGEAFAHLEFGLKQRGGFVAITGEVGTGKTTLCRYFLERLDEMTASAFILYPALNAVELLRAVNQDLGVPSQGGTAKELVDSLHRFLLDARQAGKNIVLVIDEAQNLAPEVLEQIRLISNLETATEKLIQIVLIGQSELRSLFGQKNLRQLAQRITARYHLTPLSREETLHYIRHRLAVAGGVGKVSFAPTALRAIHRFSKGIPRLINLVCDRALLAGFVLNRREIDGGIVRRAVRELDSARGFEKRWHHSWGFRGALAAAVLAGLALPFWPRAESLLGSREEGSAAIQAPGAPEPATPASGSEAARALAGGEFSAAEKEAPSLKGAPPSAGNLERATGGTFDQRLRTLSRDLSRREAAAVLLELWGARPRERPGLPLEEDLPSIARRAGFECTELVTHFDQLLQLNLPAVLELFHPSRGDTCYAALTRVEEDAATVFFAAGDWERVPLAVLDRFWLRRAFVFWKDFEGLGVPEANPLQSQTWVRACLRQLGFLPEGQASDRVPLAAIRNFQDSNYLVADGIVGPRTRMALYSLSDRYPVPRLVEP